MGLPQEACGEHRNIARKRQTDTLAAFGYVCRALLARGLQACCAPRAPLARSLSASLLNTHDGLWSKTSLSPCCSNDACGRNLKSSRKSVDTCCAGERCKDADAGEIRSVPRSSCASLDSFCAKSCCGGPADGNDIAPEKQPSVLEKGTTEGDNHCVLAVKGMTCTGCENKLIRALKSQPAISNVKTSLVLCRAEFDYNCDPSDLRQLIQTIQKRTGFTTEQIASTSSARALELTTSMPDKLMAMSSPPGVAQIVKVSKNTVRVVYDPHLIGARDVMASFETCTPVLSPRAEGSCADSGS